MQTEPNAAARRRSDKIAPRGARRDVARLSEPLRPPELLPAPVDARGRVLSAERVKWKLSRQLLDEGLTFPEVALSVATVDISPGGQVTFAAMRTIAARAGMGRSTAFKHRAALVARGVLVTEPRHEDDGAQTTSLHAIARPVFERAGVFFSWPPPSSPETGPRPGSGHKQDPLSSLDRDLFSGSVDHPESGKNQRARTREAPLFGRGQRRAGERTRTVATPAPPPPLDPAFADLATIHAAAHAEHYRSDLERAGKTYTAQLAGTIAEEHRADVAAELRSLAARALAFAATRGRTDLDAAAVRVRLTRRIVRAYISQDRPWLREHKHPLGALWGHGGTDGKPCDLLVLGADALDAWCDALDDGPPLPSLAALLASAPRIEPTAEELAEVREACAELRAAAADLPELPEPPPTVEPPPAPEPPAEDMRAALARIDAEARRDFIAKARARRAQKHRGGRIQSGTRPRARLAFLAALMVLAGTAPREDEAPELRGELAPVDEAPEAHDAPHRGPPLLLRDARTRPGERVPRRGKPPPRGAS